MSPLPRSTPAAALGCALLAVLLSAAPRVLALENEAAVKAAALRTEEELARVIERAAAAFVFIGGGSGIIISPTATC